MQQPQRTLGFRVEDVLLVGRALIIKAKLDYFKLKSLGFPQAVGGEEDVWVRMLARDPNGNSGYRQLMRGIFDVADYRFAWDTYLPLTDVMNLHHEGVDSLEQWRDFGGRGTVTSVAGGRLSAALSQVLNE
ncbi:putative retrotransposon hot spot (RHS) protein [Trypanosoma cruzi]|nr:putative retrotransposon hot spot (RHS) protein [Trypanosoma cruzi]